MGYRAPVFYLIHAGNVANALDGSAFEADFPSYRAFDGSPATLAKWSTSIAHNWLGVDRGAGTLEALDTVIIPAGHDLDGETIVWETSPIGSGWSTWGTSSVPSGPGTHIHTLPSSTVRWVRMRIPAVGQQEIPELYFSRARTPGRGPSPAWRLPDVRPVDGVRGPTRFASVRLAPNRRAWTITLERLRDTDLDIIRELSDGAPDQSFYFLPPDDSVDETSPGAGDGPPILVRAVRIEPARQASPEPAGPKGPALTYTITLEEQTA